MKAQSFITCMAVVSMAFTAQARPGKHKVSPVYDVLIKGTQSGNMLARATAVSALSRFKKNKDVLKYVSDALHDPQWVVRKEAIITLYRLGKKGQAIEELKKATEDPTLNWRTDFADFVQAMSKRDAVKFVKSELNNPKCQIKKDILLSLLPLGKAWVKFVATRIKTGNAPDLSDDLNREQAVSLIAYLTKTKSPKVAVMVMHLAKKFNIKLSDKSLILLTKIKEKSVRAQAALLLALQGNPKALSRVKDLANASGDLLLTYLHIASLVPDKKIVPVLKKRFLNDKTPAKQLVYVLTALAKMHDKDAAGFVAKGLNSTDMNVRIASIRVLPLFQGAMALKTLHKLLMEGNDKVKVAAAKALGDLAKKQSIDVLQGALNQAFDPKFKLILVRALSRINDVSVVDVLSYHIYDPDPKLKKAAIIAIAKIRDKKAATLLRAFMEDPDPDVRKAVLENAIYVDPKSALDNFQRIASGLNQALIKDLALEFGKRFIPFIKNAVASSVQMIRNAAFACMDVIPAKERYAFLKGLASTSEFPDVRINALITVAKGSCRQACPMAVDLIDDKDEGCRLVAIRVAGQCCGGNIKVASNLKNLLLSKATGPMDITAVTAAAAYVTMPRRVPKNLSASQVNRWLNH